VSEQGDIDRVDMEQRLRRAFRAVATLPDPAAVPNPNPNSTDGPGRHHRGRFRSSPPLIAVVTVAALALVVGLAVAFGPRSATPPGRGGAGPASQPSTTTLPAPSTEQITYQPFDGSQLNPSLHLAARQSGECFAYGGGADGRYLYRCGTLQPCFAGADGTSAPLACPIGADPLSNTVTLWQATSVDRTGFVPAATRTPWAMQLSDGVVCALVNAAWSGLGPFGCTTTGTGTGTGTGGTGAASGPADCRQPAPAATLWTAECQDQLSQSSPFTPLTVVKVWF
jgi:hypothetical protein